LANSNDKRSWYPSEHLSRRNDHRRGTTSTIFRIRAVGVIRGYSRPNLFRLVRFAEFFLDGEIVSTLSRQLSWSHFVEICNSLAIKSARRAGAMNDLLVADPKVVTAFNHTRKAPMFGYLNIKGLNPPPSLC
jgi:hypothetical protein